MASQQNFLCKKIYILLVISVSFSIFGQYVFLKGFMPTKISSVKSASLHDLPEELLNERNTSCFPKKSAKTDKYKPSIERMVLIVIDALRADFLITLLPENAFFRTPSLPFTENLIKNGKALSFISKAHSPTVTLPRIKTLVTGSVSSFSDVILNFKADKLNEDNILTQAHNHGKKIVFYGDDTWIKLFPDIFLRSEGTQSFFVSDYKEVDDNVTRHLSSELSKTDWDILILHYLGVDHIGHTLGPLSPIMNSKLREMDSIIQFIYETLQKTSSGLPSIIVICSDHGMTVSGSHGGVSEGETLTPLVFINTREWACHPNYHSLYVLQVDLAVTLAVLLGIPIPENSIGNAIPEVLHSIGLSMQQLMYAMYYNLFQLSSLYSDSFGSVEQLCSDIIKKIIAFHREWLKTSIKNNSDESSEFQNLLSMYTQELGIKKETLLSKSTGYDSCAMVIGLLIIWCTIFCITLITIKIQEKSTVELFCVTLVGMLVIAIIVMIILAVHLFSWNILSTNLLHNITAMLLCLILILLCKQLIIFLKKLQILHLCHCSLLKGLICFLVLHILSFSSSSFIEEEHQTWYFLASTLFFLYFLSGIKSICHLYENKDVVRGFLEIKEKKYMMTPFCNNKFCFQFEKEKPCNSIGTESQEYNHCVVPLILLILCRLFRSWNHTGDKWAHLPDIADWLALEDQIVIVNILVIISQIVIYFVLKAYTNLTSSLIIISAMIWLYLYKCQTDIIFGLKFIFNVQKELIGPWIIYSHLMTLLFLGIIKYMMSSFHTKAQETRNFLKLLIFIWILLAELLNRVYNIPIIAGIVVQEHFLNKITWKQSKQPSSCVLSYLVIMMCSFFYQGNSNSLSTLDVFAGYTGLPAYNPVLVGILMICNTYCGLLFWLLMIFYRIYNTCYMTICKTHRKEFMQKTVMHSYLCLVLYRLVTLAIYIVLLFIQKHHLFIWTVFAPKLLYENAHTLLFICIFILVISVSKIITFIV